MAKMLLTIQQGNTIYEPPIKESVKLERERTGSPGKLTFTMVHVPNSKVVFQEGDVVRFYYDNKPVFAGYIFSKKHSRERDVEFVCYDQIRYLKNKYTYLFEKKTASQIVKALCEDFKISVGRIDDTKYVIPAIAEENKTALDIILDVLEETLANTGDMFILYDDFGKIQVRNSANMVSKTLIFQDSAENFDYSSSIDEETYNNVVLYYKMDDKIVQMYTATSPTTVAQWGLLRYFEEVKNPSIGQNKANALLKMYNRKTRTLKVTGAFGDTSVRGGTLIPINLVLDDTTVNNFMVVDKVTHKFDNDHYIMDLTLEGAWTTEEYEIVSQTIGELPKPKVVSYTSSSGSGTNKFKEFMENVVDASKNSNTVNKYYSHVEYDEVDVGGYMASLEVGRNQSSQSSSNSSVNRFNVTLPTPIGGRDIEIASSGTTMHDIVSQATSGISSN